MVALAPNALPIDETIIKLAHAPKYVPVCRKTIKKMVDQGRLEAWWWGDTQVTTKEACSRAAVPVEPTQQEAPRARRRAPQSKAQESVDRFLALK